ncbi:hypothetical protein [Scopulibacillus darangshiensis]|uniref:hypothetical protein n=1 Tax=Scopulibacillus darangshiensis TaxID=442528 RepID=UPI001405301E|nr:hypothetical protein [Scopulibacillus darangshiensis]
MNFTIVIWIEAKHGGLAKLERERVMKPKSGNRERRNEVVQSGDESPKAVKNRA